MKCILNINIFAGNHDKKAQSKRVGNVLFFLCPKQMVIFTFEQVDACGDPDSKHNAPLIEFGFRKF